MGKAAESIAHKDKSGSYEVGWTVRLGPAIRGKERKGRSE